MNIGAMWPGANLEFDLAVQARPRILQFLQQDSKSPSTLEQSRRQLLELAAWIDQMERAIKAQAVKMVRGKT